MAEILHDNKYYSFERHGEVNKETPVFILPPFAGRGGSVTDNLVAKCVAAGRTVYRYELKSATHETKDLSIGGLTQIIRWCHDTIIAEHGSREIDLIGTCQGGWLAAIYASMYPGEINKLALFAAPINTKPGCGNAIERYCENINLPVHRWIMAMHGGIQPGILQWLSFSAIAPWHMYFGRYCDLIRHYQEEDEQAIEKWKKVNLWLDSPKDLAQWYFAALEDHFVKNKLYTGEWEIYGRKIDLSRITCPLYVFAGAKDDITSVEQARGIMDKVSSTEKHFVVFPQAGHTRVFTGSKELDQFAELFFDDEIKGYDWILKGQF